MPAIDRLIASELVQYLAAHASDLAEVVEPSFCYAPSIDMASEKRVRVLVAPRDRNRSRQNRPSVSQRDHLTQLAIIHRIQRGASKGEFNAPDDRIDQLIDLVASIDDLIMGKVMAGAHWLSSATDPLYDVTALRVKGVFFSVLTINYRLVA